MARTDIHSIKNLKPEDYKYFGFIYPIEILTLDINNPQTHALLEKRRELVNTYIARGANIHGGINTCDHCGAWFKWGAVFEHKHTGELITVGWQCEENSFGLNNAEYERKRVAQIIATIKARQGRFAKLLGFCRGIREELHILNANNRRETGVGFLMSLRRQLSERCELTERQVECIKDAWAKAQARWAADAAEALEPKKPVPVTDERIKVSGEVLGTRSEDTMYGYQTKMLVKCDGYKLWGTMPSQLLGVTEKGDKVEFMAKVTRSDKDENFGFFSRPTKAVNLSA